MSRLACSLRASLLALTILGCAALRVNAQAPHFFTTARSPMAFGAVKVGKDSTRKFYFINTGGGDHALHVQVIGPYTSNFKLETASTLAIDSGMIDSVEISFVPAAAGPVLDSILLVHDGDTSRTKSPMLVRLTGFGLSASDTSPRIAVNKAGLTLSANIDSTRIGSFIIRNTSDTVRYLTGTITGIHDPFTILSGDTNFTLKTGDSDVVTISFAPKTAIAYNDTLTIASNADSLNRVITFPLRGTGVDSRPSMSLSLRYVDLGIVPVGKDTVIELVLGNTGNSGVLYDTVIGPTSGPFHLTKGAGPSVLQAKQQLTIDLDFNAQTAGTYLDSLIVNTNAGFYDAHIVVPLNAIAQDQAAVKVQEKIVAFDIEQHGHTVRITNPSNYAGAQAAIFDEAGSCHMTSFISASPMTELDITPLPHGTYFLEVTAGTRSQIKRIVR